MTITATIIADSVSPENIRLTTLQLRYPKFIHGELMTHRVFSRNASSSRAIPVSRLIKDVLEDPAMPIHWGANQKGMQADEECNEQVVLPVITNMLHAKEFQSMYEKRAAWLIAMHRAIEVARAFDAAGYHKQIVNRLIEPFCHINVVVTSTEWSNFFALRCHKDAQPEMRVLAECMREAIATSSQLRKLHPGEWHLPYVSDHDRKNIDNVDPFEPQGLIKLSVARCARVSYLTQEGKEPHVLEDLALYDRLVAQVPLHASPAEHQATPDKRYLAWDQLAWDQPELHGNLNGWIQYRKTLQGETS